MRNSLIIHQLIKRWLGIIFFVLLIFTPFYIFSNSKSLYQIEKKIKGVVVDENGKALEGVTIQIKGSREGAISDSNGEFEIVVSENESANAILVFSSLGYQKKEISLNGQSFLNVILSVSNLGMNELVVVGYGTKKRSEITGAIDQVGSETFSNKPILNVAQGLQGALPNLNITFGDGQPNRGGSYNIRGYNSINGGSPLVLVDGIPGNMRMLDPEDIENVTVLKDAASAAIYGGRAGFGVILVTTKKAREGKTKIRFTSNYGVNKPLGVPRVVKDPLENAMIQNEAYRGFSNSDAPGMLDVIEYLKRRKEDPTLYSLGVDASGNFIRGAKTDWYKEFYTDYAPFSKNHLSFSGSSGNMGYYLSGGFERQEGIFRVATDIYKRYNLRLKLDNQLTTWLKIFNNTELSKDKYDSPNKFVSDGGYNIYRYLSIFANPYEAIRTADGNYTEAGMVTFGQLRDAGRGIKQGLILKNTTGFETNFFDNKLSIKGDYTYFYTQSTNDIQYHTLQYEQRRGQVVEFNNPNYYYSNFSESNDQIINLFAQYNETIRQKHHLSGLIGFNQELFQSKSFAARRDNNITKDLGALTLTTGDPTISDNKYEWALRGYFGRLSYDYDDKYLFEFNGRYDGTSRFERSSRFGFFPSVSVGWILSREDFFKPLSGSIDLLKLRASYGSLGNQQVGTYAYISTMTPYTQRVLRDPEGSLPLAIKAPALVPDELTWETVNTLDFGFNLSMFKEKLSLGFDWYSRDTKDMLTKGKTLPAVLGTTEPKENAADLNTKGWETSISWSDGTALFNKPFSYSISLVISDNRSHITKFDNPNRLLTDRYVGQEVGEIWGYTTLGFFETDEESLEWADQSQLHLFPGMPLAGDLKFEDKNGDLVIDNGANTVDDPGDRSIIGNTTAHYSYGVNFDLNWNNFSLSLFFQGIGRKDFYPGTEAAAFWGFYNRWNQPVYEHIYGNYWTPENPDAYFPRLRAYEALTTDRELGAVQTRYLQNAGYVRLKSLILGYSLPKNWINKVGLTETKVFFSGMNLWTHTKLSKAFDPEGINNEQESSSHNNGQGFVYPIQQVFTFGLEIGL